FQVEAAGAFAGDVGDDVQPWGDIKNHLIVDSAVFDAGNGAGKIIACGCLDHDVLYELKVVGGHAATVCQLRQKTLVFAVEPVEQIEQFDRPFAEGGPAAMPAARGTHDQGLAGQVVHCIDRIPGGLVAQTHFTR